MRVESGEIIKALRCSATPSPKGTDCLEHCKGCPYDRAEGLEELRRELEEDCGGPVVLPTPQSDGLHHYCDVDQIGLDAAERIEELEKRIVKALCNMHAMAEGADSCFMCKHDNHADVDSYCQGCDGENFEWKE